MISTTARSYARVDEPAMVRALERLGSVGLHASRGEPRSRA